MKGCAAFFEIPAVDFERATRFYEELFGLELTRSDCGHEKMACFPAVNGLSPGAVSWSSDFEFKPSDQGVLVSLHCDDMPASVETIGRLGGTILIPRTKIEDENRGYFCVFLDCEGNRLGLYSAK